MDIKKIIKIIVAVVIGIIVLMGVLATAIYLKAKSDIPSEYIVK